MSKAVRIREHLYDEIEKLAKAERRSIIGQLEILLEQALRMSATTQQSVIPQAALIARAGGALAEPAKREPIVASDGTFHNPLPPALIEDTHFKPDPK